jgi:hypothetical protein
MVLSAYRTKREIAATLLCHPTNWRILFKLITGNS